MLREQRAFSLLEVVLAVGVFALGIVVVIGLFIPVARSVGQNAEAEAASQLGAAIRAELQQRARAAGSLAPVVALLKEEADASDADAASDAQLLFATRDGSKIAAHGASEWGGSDAEKFFEVALLRNAALSLDVDPDQALFVVYTARIRWPAFVADQTATNSRRARSAEAANVGQRVLFLPGSVRR